MSDAKEVIQLILQGRTCLLSLLMILMFSVIPVQSVFATSGIARDVETFCAPTPTMPNVNSCSSCHSTTNNRGLSDLTAAGQWSRNRSTFINFCPSSTGGTNGGTTGGTTGGVTGGGTTGGGTTGGTTTGGGTGTGGATTGGGTGRGMGSGRGGGSRGMGRGRGGSSDDDDDDHDDDDDDGDSRRSNDDDD